ncbi:hypothetical protein ADN00_10585 [Ornatilinea apprima]|uniref:Osmotically inducible protein C n=1 Tax=Ornatilinea apprima TaxID=1134406 RepID=A0A0P6XL96_9CHLR|nr:OsmC family protein [Ornatilinea apprima]KPL77007.1 hypothetical protein ADN00_10585 [Ornatilinea apprima]
MPINKTVTISAKSVENFLIELNAGPHKQYIDQPETMGGKNAAPTPLDYFFFALGGCIITIAKIVAKQRQIEIRDMSVTVEGGCNTAVLMGKSKEDRAGFHHVVVKVNLDADMTDEEKIAFLEEVDSRCPISENIVNPTPVKIELV